MPLFCQYRRSIKSGFYFRWADFNNVYMNDWDKVATHFLLDSDGASVYRRLHHCRCERRAAESVAQLSVLCGQQNCRHSGKTDWTSGNQRGGYIWHTTGSGKTVSSFKAAQLISRRRDADKVIFLLDRIELGKQSLEEYQNFADSKKDVQATENTAILLAKLKSKQDRDRLIVTSIQK